MLGAVVVWIFIFFFNDTATTEIYTLSLHDALPISGAVRPGAGRGDGVRAPGDRGGPLRPGRDRVRRGDRVARSEEHTSELQSRQYLVCRLLLEKKKKQQQTLNVKRYNDLPHNDPAT